MSASTIPVGTRFGVYNGDAKGTVLGSTSDEVTYHFDHDLETVWTHSRKWYEENTRRI